MRKIALFTLTFLPLFAGFFPSSFETSIQNIQKNTITLTKPFPTNGMSGIAIHRYNDEIEAVTSRVIQNDQTHIQLLHNDIIKHDKLPTINTKVAISDTVIGGYLYNNILLLAPDAQTYARITEDSSKNWIHPDLYALFLESFGDNIPTLKNLKVFSKKYQVGLIYILTPTQAKLLDPISGKIVSEKRVTHLPQKTQVPFYMRFKEIDSGIFSSKTTKNYYQLMDSLL